MSLPNLDNSFFNVLESKQPKPTLLSWSYIPETITLTNEDYIYAGDLITLGDSHTKLEKSTYILTINRLIKCENPITDNPINKPLKILASLALSNPRLYKIEERDLRLYYFFRILV